MQQYQNRTDLGPPKCHVHTMACLVLAILLATGGSLGAESNSPALVSVPRFTHPGAGQVFYFVLTDRFENGSKANDTGGINGGPDVNGFDPTRISHFHGGDFVGLTSKLDYIKGLGTTAIWITPPFRNMAMSRESAGYHGYWILDFTQIDPHLGTEAEFREFVAQAHARGMKVYLDIVVNHTADVIKYKDGDTAYRSMAEAPFRDSSGRPFDPHLVAYNGINSPEAFPQLSVERSFAHVPVVAPADVHAKGPEWLNDLTLYHNRGDSTFKGESAIYGDFSGLDDVFTESPIVVNGFIDVFSRWIELYGIDGYRIDTVRHVNIEFWQAFAPAIRSRAASLGKTDFLLFGEVANMTKDVELMSEFTTTGTLDATLDFGFYVGARDFVSRGRDSAELDALFARDDLYTDHDSNAHNETTFVSNHDDGRLGLFLTKDNPGVKPDQLATLDILGQELLLTVRGQPVIYYGDEQGMVGSGGDMGAREDMFASQAPRYRDLALLGTSRTGKDDKFDSNHPFYRAIHTLAALRESHPGLSRGAMLLRPSGNPHVFAFSRIERAERVEYLVALNNSRQETLTATLQTSQAPGAPLRVLFDSTSPGAAQGPELRAANKGQAEVTLAPLQLVVWQAEGPLGDPANPPTVRFANPAPGSMLTFTAENRDAQVIPHRQEFIAEVSGGDGFAEVTFCLRRGSRPGQFELMGTADRPPYRVFWRPPADLAPGDTLSFVATVDDLRGHRASSEIDGLKVAPSSIEFGIKGATVPLLSTGSGILRTVKSGADLILAVTAVGTEPLDYSWLHDGRIVPGAKGPDLKLMHATGDAAGHYTVLVHNREGTAVSRDLLVSVVP
jgi:glycosidase